MLESDFSKAGIQEMVMQDNGGLFDFRLECGLLSSVMRNALEAERDHPLV